VVLLKPLLASTLFSGKSPMTTITVLVLVLMYLAEYSDDLAKIVDRVTRSYMKRTTCFRSFVHGSTWVALEFPHAHSVATMAGFAIQRMFGCLSSDSRRYTRAYV